MKEHGLDTEGGGKEGGSGEDGGRAWERSYLLLC